MITDKSWVAHINPNKDYVFLLEHLEPAMTFDQLERVIKKHNDGMHYLEIAKQERRNPAEIIVALLHQATVPAKSDNQVSVDITRPLANLIRG